MITFLIICFHILMNGLIGLFLLSFSSGKRNWAETLLLSILIGMYVETLLVFILLSFNIPLNTASWGVWGGVVICIVAALYKGKMCIPNITLKRPKWYEWILCIVVGGKFIFVIWQLTRTHIYFHDSITHWSGRAHSLFGAVNWSFNPESPFFLV